MRVTDYDWERWLAAAEMLGLDRHAFIRAAANAAADSLLASKSRLIKLKRGTQ